MKFLTFNDKAINVDTIVKVIKYDFHPDQSKTRFTIQILTKDDSYYIYYSSEKENDRDIEYNELLSRLNNEQD